MKKHNIIKAVAPWLPALVLAILTGCQDNAWDDHYDGKGGTATANLMEVLQNDGNYSEFCKWIKAEGMDTLLSTPQSFTVWAPTNEAMSAFQNDGEIADHFLRNHICRYIYNEADLNDTTDIRVKMLNGKFQDFSRSGSGYTFAGVELAGNTLEATNGIIHPLKAVAPFYLNLYEFLADKNSATSKLYAYVAGFGEREFNRSASTAVGKNKLGQLVYDSVFVYKNSWMSHFGDINKEDSTYTMIVPTDGAWAKGETVVKPLFRTFGTLLSSSVNVSTSVPTRKYATDDALADSLTDAYMKENMAANLVFRGKINPLSAPGDSLTATSGNVFHHPSLLFASATPQTKSNGNAWVTESWPFKPTDCFLKELNVEAEKTVNRYNAYSTVLSRSAAATVYKDSVSEQKYLEVTATSTNVRMQPTVQFTIPDVLAATYDVYCVFAPATASSEDATIDSTRVNFYLNYVHSDGTMKEDAVIHGGITHGNRMTRMYVGRFTFPFANFSSSVFQGSFSQDAECVRLRVQTNVANSETTKLSRTMRIDRIIFKPVTE
ncbi:MAG: fasciclin domain-containing protein [Prevotella sp.]